MHMNKVEICGVNTSKLPVLTNEEMRALFEKMHKGDKSAREKFIKGNLGWSLALFSGLTTGVSTWMTCSK